MKINVSDAKKLSYKKQLAFAYLICNKLYPNYLYFSNTNNFGNPGILMQAIDFLKKSIFSENVPVQQVLSYIPVIDKIIPEPADYDSVLASSALDSCTTLIESLKFIVDKDPIHLEYISTMATDTVDMYIQEKENLNINNDPDIEEKIREHPLMQNEIRNQTGIISYLKKIDDITPYDIEVLSEMQNSKIGNLKLLL